MRTLTQLLALCALVASGCNVATGFDDLYEPRSDAYSCPNHWTGSSCDVCPDNWDDQQDCNTCRNEWTGADCQTCPDNWDADADCAACAGNWDSESGCTACVAGYEDVAGNECGTCVRHVSTDGSPVGDGLTWGTAVDAVQSGIISASQAGAGCQVWVQEGTYAPTLGVDDAATFDLEDGVELYGGFPAGTPTWAERDPAAHATLLHGGGRPDHVVTAAVDNVIDGFTITGGGAWGTNISDGAGSGLFVAGVTITVNNCLFTGNATKRGGALYVDANGVAYVNNCVFDSNTGQGSGSAILIGGGTVEIADSAFIDNTASFSMSSSGGAIRAESGSQLTIRGSTFTGNTTDVGGGAIRADSADVVLETSRLTGNAVMASDCRGGAVYVGGSGTLAATRTLFGDNEALNAGDGGGLYLTGTATAALTNCIFSGNRAGSSTFAPEGGAIYAGGNSLTVTNCTFFSNSAVGTGDPGTGGAIHTASGTTTGINSITWDNYPNGVTDTSGIDYYWATFSDVEDGAGPPSNSNRSVDPLFVSTSAPYDLHLQSESECINLGTTTGAPTDDYDGYLRVGQPDAGAYEFR